jgi:hypothetical protein
MGRRVMHVSNQGTDGVRSGVFRLRALVVVLSSLVVATIAGCSGQGTNIAPLQTADPSQPADVAVRSTPVVPGRRARVFIFAGLGDKCEQLTAPTITITQPPGKGDVAFVPGQETTIQYSAKGTCTGRQATGTGVYYTAREGSEGVDSFAVSARLQSGETVSRTFQVTIAQ